VVVESVNACGVTAGGTLVYVVLTNFSSLSTKP